MLIARVFWEVEVKIINLEIISGDCLQKIYLPVIKTDGRNIHPSDIIYCPKNYLWTMSVIKIIISYNLEK